MCCSTWMQRARATICGKLPSRCGISWYFHIIYIYIYVNINIHSTWYWDIMRCHLEEAFQSLFWKAHCSPDIHPCKSSIAKWTKIQYSKYSKAFEPSLHIANMIRIGQTHFDFTLSVHMVTRRGRISWQRSLCQRNTGWSLSGPKAGLGCFGPPELSAIAHLYQELLLEAVLTFKLNGSWVPASFTFDVWAHFRFFEIPLSSCSFKWSGLLKHLKGTWLPIIAFWFTKVPGLPMSTLALT